MKEPQALLTTLPVLLIIVSAFVTTWSIVIYKSIFFLEHTEDILPVNTNSLDTINLAAVINAECGVCDESEQRKTGSVVLNRVDSELFPNDIFSVITQKGQFGVYYSDTYYLNCLKISRELLNGVGRVDKILYFWNPKTAKDTQFINQMQDRILYKEKYHYYAY